jgi:BirA family biotin operon repressor/biotin-[acetyl-CoA-carboxylase] ligase
MWGEVIRYAEATSTNDLARDHARRGAGEGTAVLAAFQSRGRGRRGRTWEAPAGKAMLASIILRPPAFVLHSAWLTLAAGVAAARAVRDTTERPANLKWPNDLVLAGKKAGGMLTETFRLPDGPACVLGFGVNLTQQAEDFSSEIETTATSLLLATGREVGAEELLARLAEHLQEFYTSLSRGDSETVRQAWCELDQTVGREVTVEGATETWQGSAVEIDEHGALWVRTPDGENRRVTVGDVTLRYCDQ